MKNQKQCLLLILLLFTSLGVLIAQESNVPKGPKPTMSVLNVDSKGLSLDPVQMGNLVRIELDKLNLYQVMDRYDVAYMIQKNELKIDNCYGKICLVEVGKKIGSDKMFTGSVELYGETIIITLRIIDVASASIEKAQIREFLNLPKELQNMIQITLHDLFGMTNDADMVASLTKRNNYDNQVNNPNETKLSLDGPRMGFTVLTGETASIFQKSEAEGGYNAFPVLFQFGYQFEQQYLNSGNFQALFEFIPLVTGLDQGFFIPSFTILNGFRNNRNGWEFAFGPTFNIVRKTNGYYDNLGAWHQSFEWDAQLMGTNPYKETERLDSRGNPTFNSSFIFAFGKSFRSGKLNIPVNIYVIPGKDGWRTGFSFGFNARRKNN